MRSFTPLFMPDHLITGLTTCIAALPACVLCCIPHGAHDHMNT